MLAMKISKEERRNLDMDAICIHGGLTLPYLCACQASPATAAPLHTREHMTLVFMPIEKYGYKCAELHGRHGKDMPKHHG